MARKTKKMSIKSHYTVCNFDLLLKTIRPFNSSIRHLKVKVQPNKCKNKYRETDLDKPFEITHTRTSIILNLTMVNVQDSHFAIADMSSKCKILSFFCNKKN